MKLSIVTTLYHSADYVREFHRRASCAAKAYADLDYEIIMVNDGSPDRSAEIAVQLAEVDPNLVVINLSRNFGHHKAIMTGLMHAKGDQVYLIDSDLEERPEWLSEMATKLVSANFDSVHGVQRERKGDWVERRVGAWYYTIFTLLTGERLSRNWVTARLMTRRFVNAVIQYQEREMFLGGVYLVAGFNQGEILIDKANTSPTTYNLRNKIALLVNSVTAFSSRPLVGIFYFGLLISVLAFTAACYVIVLWIFSVPVSGWASVIVSIWLLGGLCISFIGVVGIYVSKIYSETKQRPNTIISDIYRKGTRDA